MSFFFTEKIELPNQKLDTTVYSCNNCSLNKPDRGKLLPKGSKNPLIYVVGSFPNMHEEQIEEIFRGANSPRTGDVLSRYVDVDTEVRFNNVLGCRPSNKTGTSKKAEKEEMLCCKGRLFKDIEETKPTVIIGLGYLPLNLFVSGKKIKMWRGRLIPIKINTHECWFLPLEDPVVFMEKEYEHYLKYDSKEAQAFKLDIKELFDFLNGSNYTEPLIIDSGFEDNIEIIYGRNQYDFERIKERLRELAKLDKVVLDIETTRLKPYHPDSRLVTIAIGTYEDTIVFPIEWVTAWEFNPNIKKYLMDELKWFLLNSGIKIAHNLKFELEWFFYRFNMDKSLIYDTKWGDTQAKAYSINENTSKEEGMLNLDTLCFQNFGVNLKRLNSKVDRKNIEKSKLKDVLLYNGMDTKYTDLLNSFLDLKVDRDSEIVYNRLIETSRSLTICQAEGLTVDIPMIKSLQKEYDGALKEVRKKIESYPKVKKDYKDKYGVFNPLSDDQCLVLFEEIHGYECINDEGKASTDKTVLKRFVEEKRNKLAGDILTVRELNRAKSTYLDSIYMETDTKEIITSIAEDDKLHPEYNLMFTSTGRLSSGKGEI